MDPKMTARPRRFDYLARRQELFFVALEIRAQRVERPYFPVFLRAISIIIF
jgi:hypothetical protein